MKVITLFLITTALILTAAFNPLLRLLCQTSAIYLELQRLNWKCLQNSSTGFLILMVSITMLGCSSRNLTQEEANALLRAQAQQVQIDALKFKLDTVRGQLTQVLPQFKVDPKNPPKAPDSLLGDLTGFLETNDCILAKDKVYCYKLTLTRLIKTTQTLDQANVNLYASQVTINQLVGNIDTIIQTLNDAQVDAIPKDQK